MSRFTFWKGFADTLVGVILLVKPELIYHSAVAKALNRLSGLRLPNPYPVAPGEVSSQHAVAIMVIAVGAAHMRAAGERRAIPAFALMDALWSLFAFSTVAFAPHRATSALLMTGLNHAIFATAMARTNGIGLKEIVGLENDVSRKSQ